MRVVDCLVVTLMIGWPGIAGAQSILVPMDRTQHNHLKAYGLTYWTLEQYSGPSGYSITEGGPSYYPTWRVFAGRLPYVASR